MTIQPQKINWWYESIVDWMLQNPNKTKTDAAHFFNVSKVWMYQVTNSDVFRALYEERRKVHNGLISGAVIEKTEALTEMALDHLSTRVAEHGEILSPEFLKGVAEMGLEKLGYDGKYSPKTPPPVNGGTVSVNILVADRDSLAEARQRAIDKGHEIAARPIQHLTYPTTPLKAIIDVIEKDET